ncbi:hypothetical protein XaCFBP7622_07340 [Xanthomonas arboricola]|nr:hypothetical protein XaCFBP7622_07340 [Xanthomonas arboricola]
MRSATRAPGSWRRCARIAARLRMTSGRTPPRKTAQSLQSIAPLVAVRRCAASLQQLRHCSADACIGSR